MKRVYRGIVGLAIASLFSASGNGRYVLLQWIGSFHRTILDRATGRGSGRGRRSLSPSLGKRLAVGSALALLLTACPQREDEAQTTPTPTPSPAATAQALESPTPTRTSDREGSTVPQPHGAKITPCRKGTVKVPLGAAALSASARYIAFTAIDNGTGSSRAYWLDRETRCVRLIRKEAWVEDISRDGRLVLLRSDSSTLVEGDTNRKTDLFLRRTDTGRTTRVSVSSSGTQGNRESYPGTITPDGRFVLFASKASNLATGDTNGAPDLFVRDVGRNTTTRVSVGSGGSQADRGLGDHLTRASISSDGRYVAFVSPSTNLVPGDTNGAPDAFVHDRSKRRTERVSVAPDGAEADALTLNAYISGDGRYVVFDSDASNLLPDAKQCYGYSGERDQCRNVFLHDRLTGDVRLVSTVESGMTVDGSSQVEGISENGRFVTFTAINSEDGPWCDWFSCSRAFIWDRTAGRTTSLADDEHGKPISGMSPSDVSSDGRYLILWGYIPEGPWLLKRSTGERTTFNKIPSSA